MARYIMMQGTSSHVGKSILATALCRILRQDGVKVVPFKAQNMALNSYVTPDGLEMGRAQVAQAEAAGLQPDVLMNPILLKPTGDSRSEVVLMGKPIGSMSAREYHRGQSVKLFGTVTDALKKLDAGYEAVVIEGAGSPAEVNLKDNDIVNMRVAKHLSAPVLLIADIDRGGALASLVGTLELLDEEERALVKGLVINKFRGDVSLLTPAVDFLEKKTGKPVLGIIPHIERMGIDDEDSVSLEERRGEAREADVKIAVVRTPKISNFTDFDCLARESDVALWYAASPEELAGADLIMLPGSKNTTEDMLWIRSCGIEAHIKKMVADGAALVGICGGYQMLGLEISDPLHMETDKGGAAGLGFIKMRTTFAAKKLTSQVLAYADGLEFLGKTINAKNLRGYEIHTGETEFFEDYEHPLTITRRSGEEVRRAEGTAVAGGKVFGTYIHGIFDDDVFRREVLNAIRERKGLPPLLNTRSFRAEKEESYDALADTVRKNLDMKKIYELMGMTPRSKRGSENPAGNGRQAKR